MNDDQKPPDTHDDAELEADAPRGIPSAESPESPSPPGAAAQAEGRSGETAPATPGPVSAAPTSEATTAGVGEEGAEPTAEMEELPGLPAHEIRAILEALVFASPQPIQPRQIEQALGVVPRDEWERALGELRDDYAREGRGLQLVEVAGGYQITTRPEYHDWVREVLNPKATARLSVQALETLAVIAYRQPVTLPEIIELRGVRSGGVVKTLLERRLVRIVGRKEVVGRPMLYGTTKEFLLHFGLKDLGELPQIEEFADVLGEEVDVAGLRRAIDTPRPVEVPLAEEVKAEEAAPDETPPAGDEG